MYDYICQFIYIRNRVAWGYIIFKNCLSLTKTARSMFYTKEQEDINESRLEYLFQLVHPGLIHSGLLHPELLQL